MNLRVYKYIDCGNEPRTLSPDFSPHSHLAGIVECFVVRLALSTRCECDETSQESVRGSEVAAVKTSLDDP